MLNRDRSILKFQARAALGNPILAFVQTFLLESLATLLLARFVYRCIRWLLGYDSPTEHPVERAAREHAFVVPEGWVPRPKGWQRRGRGRAMPTSKSSYAARASADVEASLAGHKAADPQTGVS
jgi:hypothetical protein